MTEGIAADDIRSARPGQFNVDNALHLTRPIGHHHDAIRQLHGFGEIVGDQQSRLIELLLDLRDLVAQQEARLFVERGERLSHQENLGLRDQRARNRDALAHAARQLRGIVFLERGQTDHIDEMMRTIHALGFGDTLQFEGKSDIVDDIAPGESRFLLKHHADGRMRRRNTLIANHHGAFIIAQQAPDNVEERGLAAARRADHGNEFALFHREGDMIDGRDRAGTCAKTLDDIIDDQSRLGRAAIDRCGLRHVVPPAHRRRNLGLWRSGASLRPTL